MTEGWQTVTKNHGLFLLILVSTLLTCFMGSFQILAQPVILAFADSTTLGIGETICASGMLVSSLWLGARGLKGGYIRTLSASLFAAGLCMAGFAWQENIVSVCLFGFLFFLALPFANNCLDCLVRHVIPDELQGRAWAGFAWQENIVSVCLFGFLFFLALPFANNCLDCLVRHVIPDELQGRAWGMISFLSQMGYVAAYTLAGTFADGLAATLQISVGRGSALVLSQMGYVAAYTLAGTFADGLAATLQISVGRGSALVILIAGILLSVTALCLLPLRPVRQLEKSTV